MYKLIGRHPRRFALILSFFIFTLYASTTPVFNVGYGDSDEFLTVGKTWGLAHPPGYPLYTTALHVVMTIPVPNTTATQRAHLLSGIFSALSLYFVTLALFELTQRVKDKKSTYPQLIRVLAITATVISIGTAKLYWTYSQVAEKYMLTTFFISIIMFLSTRLLSVKKPVVSHLVLLSFLYGLLIAHHQSAVFLLPYLLYVLVVTHNLQSVKTVGASFFSILFGFLAPQLLLLLRANPGSVESWYIHPGFQGMIDFITRADFRGFIYQTGVVSSGYFPNAVTPNQLFTGSAQYLLTLFTSFSWWVIFPVGLTVLSLWRSHKKELIALSLPFLLMGVFLGGYINWPTDIGSQATTVRFFIPSFITLAPLLCVGLLEIMSRIIHAFTILRIRIELSLLACALFLALPLGLAAFHYRFEAMNRFDLVSKLYSSVIQSTEPNSILTCYSDSSCFALIYEQAVNGLRPDVTIVPLQYPLVQQKNAIFNLGKFDSRQNPDLMYDIVTWNIGKRPVYAVDLSQYYFDLYGINFGFMFYLPQGYVARLDRTMPASFPAYDHSLSDQYLHFAVSPDDLMQRYLLKLLSRIHLNNGFIWLKIGDRTRAQFEFNTAVNLAYNLTAEDKAEALQLRTSLERTLIDPRFSPGSQVTTVDKLMPLIPRYLENQQNNRAFTIARGAVTVDPANVEARLQLAHLYELMGETSLAATEYRHVLILDPHNSAALNELAPSTQ